MPTGISLARRAVPLVLFAAALSGPAVAADYPSRPIRAIINVSAGGTADVFARTLGEELHRRLGQPLIIDPRPGGGFIVAGRACADAEPDGYTVCILSGETLVYNEFLFKRLPYDPRKDFAPITNFFFNTQALVVSAALGVHSLPELAALAKAKPGTLAYVAPSIPLGLFFDRFNRQNGTDLVRIPFKGGGEAVSGILSGTTPIAFFGLANFIEHLRGGALTGLSVDGAARSPLFPDIPTLRELGYTDEITRQYFGLVAPAATAAPIIARLHDAIVGIMNEPEFRQRNLIERGLEPIGDTPDAFARFLAQDRVLSERVVKEAGLQPQ
ncbi:MAG: tripartite tricarboxylate transporter substrate binding protein [Xanthobacteraceae bacterium]|nr:tripartite tricarboxylate transporter substrate binding protein [Xanthobacteraceae bacterium]